MVGGWGWRWGGSLFGLAGGKQGKGGVGLERERERESGGVGWQKQENWTHSLAAQIYIMLSTANENQINSATYRAVRRHWFETPLCNSANLGTLLVFPLFERRRSQPKTTPYLFKLYWAGLGTSNEPANRRPMIRIGWIQKIRTIRSLSGSLCESLNPFWNLGVSNFPIFHSPRNPN